MVEARFVGHTLNFKIPGKTSRGTLTEKKSYYLLLHDTISGATGIGECSTLPDLSIDHIPGYADKLQEVCDSITNGKASIDLEQFPSIAFGLETALQSLQNASLGSNILFPSAFTRGEEGIPINGLVWMGNREFMEKQISEKLEAGFTCIKLKIGALDFDTELDVLRNLRQTFSPSDVEIRVDANGAFTPKEALEKLERLAQFSIHSIEQPIRQGQPGEMARLCVQSPIPIALDEELIGVPKTNRLPLLQQIRPQYIILKPSLIGGFAGSSSWIDAANHTNTGWWVTSALEGNIGLNAIAQWTFTLNSNMPQGLGTGQVFTNNIPSPLTIHHGRLHYDITNPWNLTMFQWRASSNH